MPGIRSFSNGATVSFTPFSETKKFFSCEMTYERFPDLGSAVIKI